MFVRNYLLSVGALTAIFVFQAILGQLFDNDYPGHQVIFYHLLEIPQVFVQMTPPSVLMATIFTLSGMSRTNELVACYSIGVGLRQLMMIILAIVFIVSCFSLVLQDRILPPLFKKQTSYYWRDMKGRNDFFFDVKQDKIWYRSKNLIYNLKRFDQNTNTIFGMAIYQFDSRFNLIEVFDAKKAHFSPQGWNLLDGTRTVFSKDDSLPITKKFDEMMLTIAETPKDFRELEKEIDGLRIKELYRYIGRIKDTGADTKAFLVKLHARISLSLIPLVMCILAIPFSIKSRRQGGIAKDLGICFVVTFFYWLLYSVGLSLGTNGTLAPWVAAWSPSMLFLAFAGIMMKLRKA